MKVPEFLFVIVNPIMKMILRSPLHWAHHLKTPVYWFMGDQSRIVGRMGRRRRYRHGQRGQRRQL